MRDYDHHPATVEFDNELIARRDALLAEQERRAAASAPPVAENEMQPVQDVATEPEQANEAMPVGANGKKDYRAAGAERTSRHIYDELGLSEEGADKVVANNIKAADEALKKARKAAEKVGDKITDPDEMVEAEQQAQKAVEEAEQTKAFWQEVQARRAAVVKAERERVAAEKAVEQTQAENLNYRLSDEVDENGHQFVLNSEGNIEFGRIAEDTGLTPAPILLSEGVITNPNTKAGYGLLHIEARHGEQIRSAGYRSVLEFIEEVAKNYEVIRKGNDRDGRETYILQLTDKHNNTLMVELSGDGTYWNINTAGIFKTSYGADRTVVYNRHTTANQSAETDEASLSGEQSGTTPSTRMNAPAQSADVVSDGKGTDNSPSEQGKVKKSAGGEVSYDRSRKIWSGLPDGMKVFSNGRADRYGEVYGYPHVPGVTDIELVYDERHDESHVRVWVSDHHAETPGRIIERLEREGVELDSHSERGEYRDFETWDDAVAFERHVREIEAEVHDRGVVGDAVPENAMQPVEEPVVQDGAGGEDSQGNRLNRDGSLHTEVVGSVDEITDDDFESSDGEVKEQRGIGEVQPLDSERERELGEALVEVMRGAGIEVVTDEAEGQRVLDAARRAMEALREMGKRKSATGTASVPEGEHHHAVISVAEYGAKVVKNLETLAKSYENISGLRKNFLSELASVLGAQHHGSSSQYIDFKTADGRLYTIRLADHNAHVSGFDNEGREEGISIVVTPKQNMGINNDGEAHLVEFYYNSMKLRKAEGHPFAAIVRSLQQALYSGEYNDTTGLAERQEVNDANVLREMRVWHGSGADFDHFDHSHMGEGEGAQAYGWGTYVTEVDGIAKRYAEKPSRSQRQSEETNVKYKGVAVLLPLAHLRASKQGMTRGEYSVALELHLNPHLSVERAIETVREKYSEHPEQVREQIGRELDAIDPGDYDVTEPTRILYEVEIPDNNGGNYLSWDKPLERSRKSDIVDRLYEKLLAEDADGSYDNEAARNGLADELRSAFNSDGLRGGDVYGSVSAFLGGDKAASEFLRDCGFVGIEYPTNYLSGGNESGEKNYVIFNEGDARITGKERFFRTADGEVYGFTKDGKIYLDPKLMNAESPVHEYSHLWSDALEERNPEAWAHLKKELFKDKDLTEWVKKLYPELAGNENELAHEVFSHFSGRRGAERMRAEQERMERENKNGVFGLARIKAMFARLRNLLSKFWQMARDLFAGNNTRLKEMRAEDFADMALADLLNQTPLRPMEKAERVKGNDESRREVTLNAVRGNSDIMFQKREELPFSERNTFSTTIEEFDRVRERALRENGIVAPGLADMEVEVTPVEEHGFKGEKPISQAREWAFEHLATKKDENGNYIDRPTLNDGTPYVITNNAIKKYLSQKSIDKTGDVKLHLSVLKQLQDIIKRSIDAEIHASYIKGEDDERDADNGIIENQLVHRLYGAVSHNGKVYRVKTTVIEERDGENRAYTYEVTDAEIELVKTAVSTKAEPMGLPHIGTANLLQKVEKTNEKCKKLLDESENAGEGDKPNEPTLYRIREDEAPTKTGIGYKVFVLKDGKLYPPMVANPGGEATPVHVWLDADAAPVAGLSKTGRQQVKAGGKGTQGGSGKLAYRPGWHLGEIPYAIQFNRLNPATGQRELFPANFVWAEVEYADDVDYNDAARSYGINPSGKYQHSLAGLPYLPENGAYKYRTNPDPNTDPWIITGAMRLKRILTPSEVDEMVRRAGREPQQRQEGAITDEQVNALNAAIDKATQEDKSVMRRVAEQLGEKWGVPVNIYGSADEVTHSNAEEQASRQSSKGWWDSKTGRIGIVLGNHRDVDDVKATMAHEAVAHYGLRELIGEERYNEFLDEVYKHLRDDLKQRIDERAGRAFMNDTFGEGGKKRDYESHRRTQVDELFGELA